MQSLELLRLMIKYLTIQQRVEGSVSFKDHWLVCRMYREVNSVAHSLACFGALSSLFGRCWTTAVPVWLQDVVALAGDVYLSKQELLNVFVIVNSYYCLHYIVLLTP